MSTGNYRANGGRGGFGRRRGVNDRGANNNGPTGNNMSKSAGKTVDEGNVNPWNDFSDADENSKQVNASPPAPPSLLPKNGGGAEFTVPKQKPDTRQELKLSIEFPLSRGKSGSHSILLVQFGHIVWLAV